MSANKQLKSVREARGLTQAALAQLLGVEEQTVRSWERGIRTPGIETQKKLSRFFDLTPEQLGFRPKSLPPGQEVIAPPHKYAPPLRPPPTIEGNRYCMLSRVRSRWIEGVLNNSLYLATLITLGLREQPDAVENPWRLLVQESHLPSRLLPVGTRLIEVYDTYGGALLILGAPGAGKTTLLLDLAKDLLERASFDATHLIPTVFNLSSWTEKRLSLTEWFVEELQSKYQVPHSLGNEWVANHQILPLLDGLDEVEETQQAACIETINNYRQEHGMIPIVVCSRKEDYFAQSTRILLNTAIEVQPLTSEQIDAYLFKAGEGLAAVRAALQDDPVLQEMASTPLMLSTLAFTYHGMSITEVLSQTSVTERRHTILKNYVERVLQRRGPTTTYMPQQTTHYLTWLAQQLLRHGQTEFFVEHIQPNWLPENSMHRFRHTIVRLLFGGEILIFAAILGLFRSDATPTQPGLFSWGDRGLGSDILGWMTPGLGGGFRGFSSLEIIVALVMLVTVLITGKGNIPTFSFSSLLQRLGVGLRLGLALGVTVSIIAGFFFFPLTGNIDSAIYRAIGTGLYSGFFVTFISTLIFLLHPSPASTTPKEPLQPPLKRSYLPKNLSLRLLNFLLFSVCGAIGSGCIYLWQYGTFNQFVISYASIVGLFYGLVFGLANGTNLIPGLGEEIRPAEIILWSWSTVGQHLPNNLRKSALLGSYVILSMALMLTCLTSIYQGIEYGLPFGIVYGAIVGFLTMMVGLLTATLTSGWSSTSLAERHFLRPNEGIRRSLRNGLIAGGFFGLIGGLASGLMSGFAFALAGIAGWMTLGIGLALVFGVIFFVQFLTFHGGIAFAKHYLLRYYLWRAGHLPWNYIKFLDHAAERILLRRVGGGYIFSHRTLLEYFANLSTS